MWIFGSTTSIVNVHSSYTEFRHIVGLQSLECRSMITNSGFLHKLLSGKIDCPYLLTNTNINPSSITRIDENFRVPYHSTNYGYISPVSRLMRNVNQCHDTVRMIATYLETLSVPRSNKRGFLIELSLKTSMIQLSKIVLNTTKSSKLYFSRSISSPKTVPHYENSSRLWLPFPLQFKNLFPHVTYFIWSE